MAKVKSFTADSNELLDSLVNEFLSNNQCGQLISVSYSIAPHEFLSDWSMIPWCQGSQMDDLSVKSYKYSAMVAYE